eukprot:CAMPEP_0185623632 /NCGR_PEP_ID=MMETSP0436-20130131/60009_1 /TAXON_ID=626734 ORGANISM="Favella taraikaensis, Strain Fe Narragansett Bay" /NCGR_SAMPLE_ID=MMETSP0436 /ASSEMBLY_ACC=CAM_ASM_000390 /LENGTH=134 /DNA_ID=CAMNT_0028265743 /DNA_START=757 /DNA_END=1157 /DNA_ORIENTATION=+
MTEAKFRNKAIEHFRKAYNNFDMMAHLKGMYLAKQQEANLYELSVEETSDADYNQQRSLKMAKLCKSDYQSYVSAYGYGHCCHVPRLHGEVISLLTEIVTDYDKAALFRIPLKPRKVVDSKNTQLRRIRTDGDV